MSVFVIGQGYVGLSISTAAATAGHTVIGFDINAELTQNLRNGKSHIEGISSTLITELFSSGRLTFSNNPSDMAGSEIVVIAVPTPLDSKKAPDLSYVHKAADLIAAHATTPALIINESTSFPGTLRGEIAGRLSQSCGIEFEYASAPERVDPGNPNFTVRNTPRIVSGMTQTASNLALAFYESFCDYVTIVETPEVAEMAKLLENTFRQVNIALVNQMALITNKLGISIHQVIEAAATKPFGFMKFTPGLGVGGHCIPVDPSYLLYSAKNVGVSATFIELANQVNDEMVQTVIDIVESRINASIQGKKICVVGLSYKSDIADLRESPSIRLILRLREIGCQVTWSDPLIKNWNGETSSKISESEVAIIAINHSSLKTEEFDGCHFVFDCTGRFAEFPTF